MEKKKKYKIFNKTYQPICLIGGDRIEPRKYFETDTLTSQLLELKKRDLVTIKEQ